MASLEEEVEAFILYLFLPLVEGGFLEILIIPRFFAMSDRMAFL